MTKALTRVTALKNEYRSLVYILLVLTLIYFPFADKAFTVDDTLFLKAAEQILVDPLDFYGGEANWFGEPSTQYIVNENPPLVSYLSAAVASVFGFNEFALHTFFFLVLVLSTIGIYRLGRQFGCNPVSTTLIAILTPVFLVHGTNVMSDSTLLMFWIWGLVFWLNGIKTDSPKWFFLAGLSVTLGILTKYTCVFLLPLMIVSGVWQYRKPGWWLVAIFIPLIAMLGYEYYTHTLYGIGLFFKAFIYASEESPGELVDYFDHTLIGLAFLGGCFPVALLLGPLSGGRLFKQFTFIFTAGVLALTFYQGGIGEHSFVSDDGTNFSLIIQFWVFSLAGFCLVMACIKELSNGLDHDSVFLLLWFFGIFVFASYLNWTINARSFILLVPAVGILLSRRLEQWGVGGGKFKTIIAGSMIGFAGLVAVAAVYADYVWSNMARTAAREITARFDDPRRLFFQGHWGFQFYMEKAGALPMDFESVDYKKGELVVVPKNNTSVRGLPPVFVYVGQVKYSHNSIVATMSPAGSSGFYSSILGPIPYIFEKPRDEIYLFYQRR